MKSPPKKKVKQKTPPPKQKKQEKDKQGGSEGGQIGGTEEASEGQAVEGKKKFARVAAVAEGGARVAAVAEGDARVSAVAENEAHLKTAKNGAAAPATTAAATSLAPQPNLLLPTAVADLRLR